eukprot:CAMPEP_0170408130 /NCGR_PEP_ID=MMETSP0117_2-20130122/28625_1 /TAXON_ID=400756 /ORGANISM="Durinskia baltica, Strain CSIRO CS-38" /LENGTH=112 /DNA_ID=CAMNT_0010665441 /DNA_START=289 /DNA_END=623 /DNA_ORIENTATION=-
MGVAGGRAELIRMVLVAEPTLADLRRRAHDILRVRADLLGGLAPLLRRGWGELQRLVLGGLLVVRFQALLGPISLQVVRAVDVLATAQGAHRSGNQYSAAGCRGLVPSGSRT